MLINYLFSRLASKNFFLAEYDEAWMALIDWILFFLSEISFSNMILSCNYKIGLNHNFLQHCLEFTWHITFTNS